MTARERILASIEHRQPDRDQDTTPRDSEVFLISPNVENETSGRTMLTEELAGNGNPGTVNR